MTNIKNKLDWNKFRSELKGCGFSSIEQSKLYNLYHENKIKKLDLSDCDFLKSLLTLDIISRDYEILEKEFVEKAKILNTSFINDRILEYDSNKGSTFIKKISDKGPLKIVKSMIKLLKQIDIDVEYVDKDGNGIFELGYWIGILSDFPELTYELLDKSAKLGNDKAVGALFIFWFYKTYYSKYSKFIIKTFGSKKAAKFYFLRLMVRSSEKNKDKYNENEDILYNTFNTNFIQLYETEYEKLEEENKKLKEMILELEYSPFPGRMFKKIQRKAVKKGMGE